MEIRDLTPADWRTSPPARRVENRDLTPAIGALIRANHFVTARIRR
jgi:hypothetical protein